MDLQSSQDARTNAPEPDPVTGDHIGTAGRDSWSAVRSAITERWPSLDRDQLADCPNDVQALINFVDQQVVDDRGEIESVVREFAPQENAVERASAAAAASYDRATQMARSAYRSADDCISERPTESVLAAFGAGIAIGLMIGAIAFSSRPRQSASRW